MKYVGKLWLNKSLPMSEVVDKLELKEAATFSTEDAVGTMEWRGMTILVVIHVSWGNITDVRKIKILVHHLEETEDSEFWKLVVERLKTIVNVEERNENIRQKKEINKIRLK